MTAITNVVTEEINFHGGLYAVYWLYYDNDISSNVFTIDQLYGEVNNTYKLHDLITIYVKNEGFAGLSCKEFIEQMKL